MTLKVCVIEPVGSHGGMDYYDFGLCDGLSIAGVDVVLHTCHSVTKNSNIKFEVRDTYKGIYDGYSKIKKGILFIRGSIISLLSAVYEGRKIVHFHFFNIGILSFFNIILAKFLLRKIVITAHDVESFVSDIEAPFLSRLVYRLADRVVAHNKISKDELLRCMSIAESKINIITSGNYVHITENAPNREEARRLLDIDPESKVILFFGQIKEIKRLDLLIEALPAVIKKHPNAVLLIAGRPWKTTFTKYQKLIDDLNLRKFCITHIKFIPDDELPSYYMASDIVALPYERIYQSAVILMAMSFGRAVIASDLPGMTDIISNPNVGRIFKSGSSESLIEQLDSALADIVGLTTHAQNGLLHMEANFSWQQVGAKTKSLYCGISAE